MGMSGPQAVTANQPAMSSQGQAKVPMRIQRQYPQLPQSVNYQQPGPSSNPAAYLEGSTGEEDEPGEGEERAKPDGEVDANGDYVIYNYDNEDTRETNV